MRCGRIDRLIDRYVDGKLPERLAEAVSSHERSCDRCGERIAAARRLARALSGEPAIHAPGRFAERVMDAVYREAYKSAPVDEKPVVPARAYRRLGLSFVLTAALLAASLFIPSAAYNTLIRPDAVAARIARGSPALVKRALYGAGKAVRGLLRSGSGQGTGYNGGTSK